MIKSTKAELREDMRRQLQSAEVRAHSAAVWEKLSVLPVFASAKSVMAFVSTDHEIDTHGLIRQLLAMGRQVCVPAFDGERYRLAEVWDFDADLVTGKFGILEARTDATTIQPEVWLVPGLAFDVKGNRLGRGRGFFDALLREARGAKVALAHDFQLLNEVPAEAHDVRVDVVVTESRVVNCKG